MSDGELKKRILQESSNDVGPFEGGDPDNLNHNIVDIGSINNILDAAKADFPDAEIYMEKSDKGQRLRVNTYLFALDSWRQKWFGE